VKVCRAIEGRRGFDFGASLPLCLLEGRPGCIAYIAAYIAVKS
jgi:hypothetical protein